MDRLYPRLSMPEGFVQPTVEFFLAASSYIVLSRSVNSVEA